MVGLNNNPMMMFLWQASAFIVTYPVNNAIDKEGNETGKAVAWEKAFIQLVKVHTLHMLIFKDGLSSCPSFMHFSYLRGLLLFYAVGE